MQSCEVSIQVAPPPKEAPVAFTGKSICCTGEAFVVWSTDTEMAVFVVVRLSYAKLFGVIVEEKIMIEVSLLSSLLEDLLFKSSFVNVANKTDVEGVFG